MKKPIFHLLPNAHLDPVWMWNWREGLSEGLRTCRTVLDLMAKYPDLTFIRGEAAVYEHVEERDPETFSRIAAQIAAGRWEAVGGQYIQPDNNMPSLWTALRQLEIGRAYFRSRFGVDVQVGWLPDSFGHGRGTPEIFTAAGLRYFALCRPQEDIRSIGSPVFRWLGQGGSELLCVRMPGRSYASERGIDDEYFPLVVLERLIARCGVWPLRNHALTFGLGDHGGGPTRRHLDTLLEWREKHSEVEVKFSTLGNYFRAVEEELHDPAVRAALPVVDGDINFCQRGCYSSTSQLKRAFRLAERTLERGNRVQALITGEALPEETVKGLCFNAFHDILPGTLIESALEEQLQWLGGIVHTGRKSEFRALQQLTRRINIAVLPVAYDQPEAVPYVLFNSLLRPFSGQVEIEFSLDYRPVWDYAMEAGRHPIEVRDGNGKPVAFQVVPVENHSLVNSPPWRQRVVFYAEMPPGGWQVFTLGYQPNPEIAPEPPGVPVTASENAIDNGIFRVWAKAGDEALQITRNGRDLTGNDGLSFAIFEDPYGSWGDMSEKPENSHALEKTEQWTIQRLKVLESGPERARLWVEFAGLRSRVEVTLSLSRGRDALDIAVRVFWDDRCRRLKMLMSQGEKVVYEVPGGRIERGETAIVPGGRYQRVFFPDGEGFVLASDSIYGYENEGGYFAAVLARGTRYCTDEPCRAHDYPEHPLADQGVLQANFVLGPLEADAEYLSEELEEPVTIIMEAPHVGDLAPAGSLWQHEALTGKVCDIAAVNGKLNITLQHRNDGTKPQAWKIIRKEFPVGMPVTESSSPLIKLTPINAGQQL
jgi:alpha-mannosidase